MWDGEAFGKALVAEVADAITRATAPLLEKNAALEARLAELETRQPPRGEKGDPGQDGEPGAPASDQQVAAAVEAWLKANPPAAGRDGADGKDGRDGRDGEPGAPGRDGVDGVAAPVVAAAIKDHAGELVLTLTDGTVLRTGIFDGAPGENGRDGRDGADGMGFNDFDISLGKDERTVIVSFERGDLQRTFEIGFPVVIDRGVWKADEGYERGDGVTWGGSFWIAQCDTTAKPETNADWRLAVKRGRDGKDLSK